MKWCHFPECTPLFPTSLENAGNSEVVSFMAVFISALECPTWAKSEAALTTD